MKALIIVDMQKDFMPLTKTEHRPTHGALCNDYTGVKAIVALKQ
jgi:nicotinamidase-related amidase